MMPTQSVLEAVCASHGLPPPHLEFRFHPERKWRFDYAWPIYKVALEVQGGLFTRGGHVRGGHLKKEYEKLNEAQIMGWMVLLALPEKLNTGEAFELVGRALKARR